jgi:hypothetical protein
LAALGSYRLGGLLPVSAIFAGSRAVGDRLARWRGDGDPKRRRLDGLIAIGNARPPARES